MRKYKLTADCSVEKVGDFGRQGIESVLPSGTLFRIESNKDVISAHVPDREYYTIQHKGELYWAESVALERSMIEVTD
jgi:hypothetical protein